MPKLNVRVGPGVGGKMPGSSTDPNRGNKKLGVGRDRATVNRVNMYRKKAHKRDRNGKIIDGAGEFTSKTPEVGAGRVAPNRRWFGNTRVVDQRELSQFRDAVSSVSADPYSVLLKRRKLPMALVTDGDDVRDGTKLGLLETETFDETFSKKRWRKRPKIGGFDLGSLAAAAQERSEKFETAQEDDDASKIVDDVRDADRDRCFDKGQSRRIWGELHKVVDSSDVLLQVLDARDPLGTRCEWLETYLKKEAAHKHLVFILNKCDLVPSWVTARWLKVLSRDFPTVALHASVKHSFGKGALITLLRQYKKLHDDKKSISCGLIGYPNVGKSSVINMLRGEKVVNVAPIPGETKVWQYITLFKNVFLIDCPGIVHGSTTNSEADSVLKGVVRVESLKDSSPVYIPALLERVENKYIAATYGITTWKNPDDFLEKLAKKTGKLLKKGEPNLDAASKRVLHDFIRGRLPWFVPPPDLKEDDQSEKSSVATVQDLSKLRPNKAFKKDAEGVSKGGSDEPADADDVSSDNDAANLQWESSSEDDEAE
mmetsp:Transcript_9477/g.28608  ORF Transcript_9477/g.28608 Transcript_9477/m.28608 type:complete len:541 (+) Transcript_9477:87-1709(+)|eukprot:CAMPEP_0198736294 /NCGR_PEP_ID=MMETSP1475-20131203/64794_1 /TAXON_ID= ORGANISM="Unidentified sp., Strain CCMP1999" /NCGR_SAMPLE_ID=MMETSP1475 /ASSEMBLY_ACC=CAM_ASM_001111 /LENGTH=540 /DNA_ID=CAMNT_0044500075 /DNA_START=38 /DNA_END=1660 /DNA_ORIENTATION=-